MASSSADNSDNHLLPPVSALFLIVFDQKVGYATAWHRALPDVDISGVEFQSLPSGLHSVQEDLVYYLHGSQYAGVSAFARGEADEAHRNAEFVSVGVLLPLSSGRLGKGWLRAEGLRELAKGAVGNIKDTAALERYWERCQQENKQGLIDSEEAGGHRHSSRQDSVAQELERRAKGRRATRSRIESALTDDQLSPDHPALSVPALLDLFGPLIFPIYRAALLRKRILCLGTAPVQQNCNAVYILSVLASLPPDVLDKLPAAAKPLSQIKPLFNVGIHDIPTLSEQSSDTGWIACTTDEILRDKTQLYDLLIQFPTASTSSPTSAASPSTFNPSRHWPRLLTSDGTQIKATQRDLRRYKLLRLELRRMRLELRRYATSESSSDETGNHAHRTNTGEDDDDDDTNNNGISNNTTSEEEATALLQRTTSVHPIYSSAAHKSASAEIVEPVTWTAMAYNGLMWWGSAGEMDSLEAAEIEADRALLDDLPDIDVTFPASASTTRTTGDETASGASGDGDDEGEEQFAIRHKAQASATVVVAYFLRLTAQIFLSLSRVVEDSADDDGSEAAVAEGAVVVGMEDLITIGLDTWSVTDRIFIGEAVKMFFGREGVVDGGGVRLCGVRIC